MVSGRPWANRQHKTVNLRSGRQGSLGLLHDSGKTGFVVNSHIGQNLAVEIDRGFFETSDEGAVAQALLTRGRIDAGNPQRAEGALSVAAVAIGELTGAHDRLLGNAKYVAAATTIAFGCGQNFFVTGTCGDTAFDSRHFGTPGSSVRQHGAHGLDIGVVHKGSTTELALVLRGFLGEDMALERLASLDRAATANGESLGRTSFGFHLGHDEGFRFMT